MATEAERKDVDLVLERFVLPKEGLFEPLEQAVQATSALLRPNAQVFLSNLKSVSTVASIPFALTNSAALNLRFRSIHIAEKIRARKSLGPDGEPTEEALHEALQIANRRMSEEMQSRESRDEMDGLIVSNLKSLLDAPEFEAAARELLLETVVMVWGSFEVFITETVRLILNGNPQIATKLLADDSAKKHFPPRGISLDLLAEHQFNVATSMGDVLLADRRLDSLPVIKDVLGAMLPGATALRQTLATRELWTLAQRRHLIVHRRGIIDAPYLANTGDQSKVGERLKITSNYVFQSFELVRDAAIELLRTSGAG
jgi:hypothetical protein